MHTHPTRRDILRIGGTAAAAACVLPAQPALAGAAWKRVPVGTQLWCVRKQLAADIPGTLNALAAAGFDGVELENAFGGRARNGGHTSTRSNSRRAGSITRSANCRVTSSRQQSSSIRRSATGT